MKISARSIPKTFRRAGMKFTDTPKVIEVDNKTLTILKAEPLLVIEEVPDEKGKK